MQKLDCSSYDLMVIGTELPQMLLAANQAKIARASVIVLDQEKSYCSDIKTVTLKELRDLLNEEQKETKLPVYRKAGPFEWNTTADAWLKAREESGKHRGFNLDLSPRVVFGSGLANRLMQEAQLDKYLQFRPVEDIYVLDPVSLKEHTVPFTKGDIFKSSFLSLVQKRQLYSALLTLHTLGKRVLEMPVNVNSLNEFNKEAKLDESWSVKYDQSKDKPCGCLMRELCPSVKVRMLFYYVLAGYLQNPEVEDGPTTKDFLLRVSRFIESCGVYQKSPYLMLNYGSSDLAQAFCRIASVFGALYILCPDLQLQPPELFQDKVKVQTSLAESKLQCKRLAVNSRYNFKQLGQSYSTSSFVAVIVGQPETKREKYPVLVQLNGQSLDILPATIFDVGLSLSSAGEFHVWYIVSKSPDLQDLVAKVTKAYGIRTEFIVAFQHLHYKNRFSSDSVRRFHSWEGISYDQAFEQLLASGWASLEEGKYFRRREQDQLRQKEEEEELGKALSQIEAVFTPVQK